MKKPSFGSQIYLESCSEKSTFLQEILRVKDEELQNLARELRKRDSTIKDIAEKISETAEAAEAAASSARTMNEQRRIACAEIQHLTQNYEKLLESSKTKAGQILIFFSYSECCVKLNLCYLLGF